MVKTTTSSFLLLFVSFTVCVAEIKPKELITVFDNFKKAAATGKESEIAKYMSPRFLNYYKNRVASIGMDFTSEMVKNFTDHYDISNAKFLKVIENGPTTGLVFTMPREKGEYEKDKITFLILKFVKYDTWRYDNGYLATRSQVDDNGEPTVFQDSLIPEEVAIDGKIPIAPVLVPKAEIRANYFIMGMGYKVELSVNGNPAVMSNGGSSSGVLPGGIKYGTNEVSISITRIASDRESYPEIKIYYAGKNHEEVTAYKVNRDEKKTGSIKDSFSIKK